MRQFLRNSRNGTFIRFSKTKILLFNIKQSSYSQFCVFNKILLFFFFSSFSVISVNITLDAKKEGKRGLRLPITVKQNQIESGRLLGASIYLESQIKCELSQMKRSKSTNTHKTATNRHFLHFDWFIFFFLSHSFSSLYIFLVFNDTFECSINRKTRTKQNKTKQLKQQKSQTVLKLLNRRKKSVRYSVFHIQP